MAVNDANTLYELAALAAAQNAKLCTSTTELLNHYAEFSLDSILDLSENLEDAVIDDLMAEDLLRSEIERVRTPISRKQRHSSVAELLSFPNQEFRRQFRLERSSFEKLCNQLAPLLFPDHHVLLQGRDWIFTINPITLSVAISLYILGHRASLTVVSAVFGIGRSTAYKYFAKFINAMKNHYGDSAFNQPLKPTQIEKYAQDCEQSFRQKGAKWVPKIIGSVDGSHIFIYRPSEGKESYWNRKSCYSVLLQVVASPSAKILHASFGFAGRIHDATVYKFSGVQQWLPPGTTLLGDSAYPFNNQLITPFRDDGSLDRNKKILNGMVSGKRSSVERTFGQLKGRWMIMFHIPYRDMNTINAIVLVCCVLHNMCVGYCDICDFDDKPPEITENGYDDPVPDEEITASEDRTVTAKRLTLMKKILGLP